MRSSESIKSRIAQLLGLDGRQFQLIPIARHASVWCVRCEETAIAAAKCLPAPKPLEQYAPVIVEATVLKHAAPPAVAYVAHCEDLHLLLTQWAGEATLNDVCQDRPVSIPTIGEWFVDHFVSLEQRFAASRDELLPFAYPMNYPQFLRDSLDGVLHLASEEFGIPSTILDYMESQISAMTPTLGPLDCNAQNVIFSGDALRFVDLSRIGWDWPERRLVQYAFCLGAYGGEPRCVLTRQTVRQYAHAMSRLRQLPVESLEIAVDTHCFLASLVIIHRLIQLLHSPDEYCDLHEAWDVPAIRLKRMKAVTTESLSNQPQILEARRMVVDTLVVE